MTDRVTDKMTEKKPEKMTRKMPEKTDKKMPEMTRKILEKTDEKMTGKMTEKEVWDYIAELGKKGSVLGLAAVRELANRVGNPQNDIPVIHITGTNGKGSILAFVSTILKAAGYRVGRYISPVLLDYREKIQINEKMISKNALFEGMDLLRNQIREMEKDGFPSPTLFEVETVLAFWYFKKKKCDFIVLETGMGGATDATNIVDKPFACVFSKISMDHMQFLGNDLQAIAKVKSGIIKPGTRVITALQEPEVTKVLEQQVKEKNCVFSEMRMPEKVRYGLQAQSFQYRDLKKCRITLAGCYQIENACVALETIRSMQDAGVRISEAAIYQGLEETKWYGRFSILQKKPLFLVDGAHNEDAAKQLRQSMICLLSGKPLIFIVGVLKDKEYEKVLRLTADLASHILTVTPPNAQRALPAYELAESAKKYCKSVTAMDSLEEAVEMASLLAGTECAIIAFGSLSFLGALKRMFEKP
ncbi:MAG: bifunctional folylpolyglutamate synthase/dihydrofolate synthase [Lachnospiraceae bacterium]